MRRGKTDALERAELKQKNEELMATTTREALERAELKQKNEELMATNARLECKFFLFVAFFISPYLFFYYVLVRDIWYKCDNVPSFIAKIEECKFPSHRNFSLDYKNTSMDNSVAGSYSDESSFPLTSKAGYLYCSRFRTSRYPQLYRRKLWKIEPNLLDAMNLDEFFGGDDQLYGDFVDDQTRKLEKFRTFFYYYLYDVNGLRIKKETISEPGDFQPLFQLFFGGFLECLQSFHSDSRKVRRTVSVNTQELIKYVGDSQIPLTGSLDVMIFSHSDETTVDDVCMSDSHIELKSPFGALYHSQLADQAIDQLIAETDCVSAMKATAGASGPTIGALTDLFSLNLIYQANSNGRDFYLTSPVVESRAYVQLLIVLCLRSAAVERLAAVSVMENLALPEEEERADDEGGGDHGKEDFDDVDEEKGTHPQQQQQQQQQEKNTGSAPSYKKAKPIVMYIKDDKREELEEDFEFLRQYEMRRTGVTLTRANLAALGGLR